MKLQNSCIRKQHLQKFRFNRGRNGNETSKTGKTNPEILNWISKHAEALFETEKGFQKVIFQETRSFKRQTDPLSFCGRNSDRTDCLKGIKNEIARIRIVGEGTLLIINIQ
jgi:alpha-L-fucosidase